MALNRRTNSEIRNDKGYKMQSGEKIHKLVIGIKQLLNRQADKISTDKNKRVREAKI